MYQTRNMPVSDQISVGCPKCGRFHFVSREDRKLPAHKVIRGKGSHRVILCKGSGLAVS